jgi:putative PIN family toxin of toxin-antitoxin system
MRVVLDTNVLVSGLLKPAGNERRVLRLGLARKFTLLLSAPILAEYELVLPRPRFKLQPAEVSHTLESLRKVAEWVEPDITLNVTKDEHDNRFLECAVAGRADCLVTGNAKHFPARWKGTSIVAARKAADLGDIFLATIRGDSP